MYSWVSSAIQGTKIVLTPGRCPRPPSILDQYRQCSCVFCSASRGHPKDGFAYIRLPNVRVWLGWVGLGIWEVTGKKEEEEEEKDAL